MKLQVNIYIKPRTQAGMLAVAALLFISPLPLYAATFTAGDITGDTGRSYEAAMGDVNGDGHLDIYVGENGFNSLWLGDGAGNFTANNIAGDGNTTLDVVMGDVNGDGHLDVYAVNSGLQNRLWLGDGAGNFTANHITGDAGNSETAVMVDLNGDNHLDIYVANRNEQNQLWLGDGAGNFTANDITGDTGNSMGVAVGDVNGDGHIDIYVANWNNEQNRLWINDGNGNFTANNISGDTRSSPGAVMGDVNGDGHLDIYVANFGQQNRLWLGDGAGNFTANNISGDTGNSVAAVMGDVNGDGHLDIYVTNRTEQQNRLWINDGNGNFTADDITGDTGDSTGLAIGDVNGDHKLDIYVTNESNQQNRLWINTTPDNVAPTVALTAPADGANVSGTITLSATTSDNIAVAGVSFYQNGVLIGSEDTTAPYSVDWDTTATSSGAQVLIAVARDTSNNYATSTPHTITADNTSVPDSVSPSVATSTATIAWSTPQPGSTQVWFGLVDAAATSTPETNTSPRVSNHSVNLSGLIPCTNYRYQVVSRNAALEASTSSVARLTTEGCTGDATIATSGEVSVTTAAGGTLTHETLTLTVPINFTATSSSATFQAATLDSAAVTTVAGTPSGKTRVSAIYHLTALPSVRSLLDVFTQPITITLSYTAGEVSGLDESSLQIHRYNGSSWSPLSGCSVDTTARTVTCTTTQFSDFGLFGDPAVAEVRRSSSGGGVRRGCKDERASNYERFVSHDPDLCVYDATTPVAVDAPTTDAASTAVPAASESAGEPGSPETETQITTPHTDIRHFPYNLRAQMTDPYVKQLQQFLNAQGFVLATTGPGSPGNETDYFGPLTYHALIQFQEAHAEHILTPLGLTTGTGLFGPATRAFVHGLHTHTGGDATGDGSGHSDESGGDG